MVSHEWLEWFIKRNLVATWSFDLLAGGVSVGAPLAGEMESLGPVGAERAGLAVAVVGRELLAIGALLPALRVGHGLLGARGQAHAAQAARVPALVRLEAAEAARTAQVHDLVEVLAGGAALCEKGLE